MGMIGLAIIFAPAIGPVIAGFILVSYAWEMMFYGTIPLTLIVIVCLIYLRNVSERSDTKFDLISVVLSTVE
jgi:MFS family permease